MIRLLNQKQYTNLRQFSDNSRGRKGHYWVIIYYNCPNSFIITFYYSLAQQLSGLLLNFDWLGHKVECPNVLNT